MSRSLQTEPVTANIVAQMFMYALLAGCGYAPSDDDYEARRWEVDANSEPDGRCQCVSVARVARWLTLDHHDLPVSAYPCAPPRTAGCSALLLTGF